MKNETKIDLSALTRFNNSDRINWKKSIGHEVEFSYNDIKDKVMIVDYDSNNRKLKLYNSKYGTDFISTQSFIKGQLGFYLKVRNMDFKYSKSDIVNGLEILEPITISNDSNRKGYRYKCTKDGYIGEITERRLDRNNGCPVCSNKRVSKGINDVATTHPYLVKYFKNVENSFKYSYGSDIKLNFKCPDCGYEKNMNIWNLTRRGFSCNQCSDGISLPNKLMLSVLSELGIEFITEFNTDWSKSYRYDFYFRLNNINYIVEMDGQFHYVDTHISQEHEVKKIDEIKDELANNNGFAVIRIDCNYDTNENILEYLKTSIINSNLNDILNLESINWNQCFEKSLSSKVSKAWELWDSGIHSPSIIGRELSLSDGTVRRYLKIGKSINKCTYDSNEAISYGQAYNVGNKIPVICLTNGRVFNCMNYARTELNKIQDIHISLRGISDVCQNKKDNYKGLRFKYVKDLTESEIKEYQVYEQLQTQKIDIRNLDFYKEGGAL